jgi:hypothetical protein
MILNSDITIYNRVIDKESRSYKYRRTVLNNVYSEKISGVKSLSTGLLRDDKFFVIIHKVNHQETYQNPKAFEKDPVGWTLAPGDILVLGDINKEISRVKELELEFDDVYTITQVDEHYAGSSYVHHWEVWAK